MKGDKSYHVGVAFNSGWDHLTLMKQWVKADSAEEAIEEFAKDTSVQKGRVNEDYMILGEQTDTE